MPDDDDKIIDELILLVGVFGIEPLLPLPISGRVPDLNDVDRVNIKLVPLPLIKLLLPNTTRRLGGGDGGGNGTPG